MGVAASSGASSGRPELGCDDPTRVAYEGAVKLLDGEEWAPRYAVLEDRELRLYTDTEDYRARRAAQEVVPLTSAAVTGPGAMGEVRVSSPRAELTRITLRAARSPTDAAATLSDFESETATWLRKLRMASREPWMPEATACYICGDAFDVATRMHHCRRCGAAVCGPCSPTRVPLPNYSYDEPVRVCVACHGQRGAVLPAAVRAARRQVAHDEAVAAAAAATLSSQSAAPPRGGGGGGGRLVAVVRAHASSFAGASSSTSGVAIDVMRRRMTQELACSGAALPSESSGVISPTELEGRSAESAHAARAVAAEAHGGV